MALISWITPAGDLGTYAENTEVDFSVSATNPNGTTRYQLLSGALPPGVQLTPQGQIYGFPVITTPGGNVARAYKFTIRAADGHSVSDRSFSISVNSITPPVILPRGTRGGSIANSFGNIDLTWQFRGAGYSSTTTVAVIDVPSDISSEAPILGKIWTFANGAINAVSVVSPGAGYHTVPKINFIGANTLMASASINGLVESGIEYLGKFFDGDPVKITLPYVVVTPTANIQWQVVSGTIPPGLALDQTGTISGFALAPAQAGTIGTGDYDAGGYDQYVYDYQGQAQSRTYQFTVRIFDGINYATQRYKIGIYAKSYFRIDNTLIETDTTLITADRDGNEYPSILTPGGVLPPVRKGQSYAYKFDAFYFNPDVPVTWAINASGPAGYDQGAAPNPDDRGLYFTPVPFEASSYDQTSLSLPAGIYLDSKSGWLLSSASGVGATTANAQTYTFQVKAQVVFTNNNATLSSLPVHYSIQVLDDIKDLVTWDTPADLGVIRNGEISTLSISAHTNKNVELYYTVVSGQYLRIPQGLSILDNGLIVGRTSFDFFSVDRKNSAVTFDAKTNTYDSVYTFSILAQDATGQVYDTKKFKLTVANINKHPYENLYLTGLLPAGLRRVYRSIVNSTVLNGDNVIYRPQDPNFGVHQNLRILVQAGLRSDTAQAYINAMAGHHFDKQINFGTIHKAVARNNDGTVKYEVLYVDVLDFNAASQTTPSTAIGHHADISNSFANMANDMSSAIGYEFQGALPEWMTSVQTETGQPLGLVRALVLAYAQPGKGDELLYRYRSSLTNSGYAVTDVINTFRFVADRYQWDNALSINYDPTTDSFLPSLATTFDDIPTGGIVNQGAWIIRPSGVTNTLFSVVGAGKYGYVAVGNNATILSSLSGQAWTVEPQYISQAYSISTTNTVPVDAQYIKFSYSPEFSLGDELTQLGYFNSNVRSYITSVASSIRISANIANTLPTGTQLEFINNLDGSKTVANLTSTSTAGSNELYIDNMAANAPGYGVMVKGIDRANVTQVTTQVGNVITLNRGTTAQIADGTALTFEDLTGNVKIYLTNGITPAGNTSILLAGSVGTVANYYPRITAINNNSYVMAEFSNIGISAGPYPSAIPNSVEMFFTHRITSASSVGSYVLNISNTSRLPVGSAVSPVSYTASVSNTSGYSASWSSVTSATSLYVSAPVASINGTVLRGMIVTGPGIPAGSIVTEYVADATNTVANLTLSFDTADVTAASNVPISFSAPATVLNGTTIIGKTPTSITLSSPLLANIGPGNDSIINFGLTGLTLTKVIFDGQRWIAVGNGGLVVTKDVGGNTWTQRDALAYGDLVSIESRSYTNNGVTSYVYVGVGTEGIIVRSTDAITWSAPLQSGTGNTLRAVANQGTTWIAVGDGGVIITSTDDGLTWSVNSSVTGLDLYDVGYWGQWIIAGNKGTVFTSSLGSSWVSHSTGVSALLKSISYNNSRYTVVGTGGAISSSIDGGNWIPEAQYTTETLNAVSRNSSTPVAVGASGRILVESDLLVVDWAVKELAFDQFNLRPQAELENLGYPVSTGDTLIFVKQEGFGRDNDGWNLFATGDSSFDSMLFDQVTVIPGYYDTLGTGIANQRAGVWQVNVDANKLVTLVFLRPVNLTQAVTIKRDGSQVFYDPTIKPNNTVPTYTLLTNAPHDTKNNTTFDGAGTRFANHRDNYSDPGSLDKYLKFPNTGVI